MANLLEKASILITPTAYDNGSINAIKPKESPFGDLDFTRATSGSVVGTANRQNANGVLEEVAQNVPRIDYLGGEGHWLIEPQSTNLVTYSDELSQVSEWVKIGFATVNNNQAIAPTDTLIADEVLSGDNSALNGLRIDKSVVSGDDYTFSFFAKKKDTDTNYVAIRFDSFNSAFSLKRAWFNIDSGNLGTVESGITAKIEDYGDGWYRCSATQTATATASSRVLMMLTSDDNVSSLGIGLGFYGFGGQFEQQSYVTSYIPTSGGQITRDRDSFGLNTTLDTSLIDSTEGTFYAEMAALEDDGTDRAISLSDGTLNNTIWFRFENGGSNRIRFDVKTQSGDNSQFRTTDYNILNFSKLAVRFKENDCVCFVNGTEVIATVGGSTGATYPADTLTKIRSTRGNDSFPFYGKIKCIAVFKEGLTDSELTCLTT